MLLHNFRIKIPKFILLILLVSSCKSGKDNSCPNEVVDLGVFKLGNSALAFVPYNPDHQKIVFSDSLGNEFTADIVSNSTMIDTATIKDVFSCEGSGSKTVSFNYQIEKRYFKAIIEELDLAMEIELYFSSYIQELSEYLEDRNLDSFRYDNILRLKVFEISNDMNSQRIGYYAYSNYPPFYVSPPDSDTYSIHGVEFLNVYHKNEPIENNSYNIYYTSEQGFVGIIKEDESISLKYERTE
jgi:hypothetical protein